MKTRTSTAEKAPAPQTDRWEDDAPKSSAAPENDLTTPDEDFESHDAVPADLVTSESTPAPKEEPAPIKDREIEEGGGDSMLARYFREMATHPVMGQEEELATAIEVEQAEVDHWVALLSHLPAAPTRARLAREGSADGRRGARPPASRRAPKASASSRRSSAMRLTREQEKK